MRFCVRYVLLVAVCISSFLLSGCDFIWTTSNGDPASPDDVKAGIEKEFKVCNPQLVLQSSVVEKEKPFQRNVYVFYDEHNGFSFSVRSDVKHPTLPVPGGQRNTNADFAYAEAYLTHLNGKISELARNYGMRTATVDEQAMLTRSKLKRQTGMSEVPLFDEGEFIFVDHTVKGADMVAMLKKIYAVYKPNDDEALLRPLFGRKVSFYYLPIGEQDKTKAVYIEGIWFKGKDDWRATLLNVYGSSSFDTSKLESGLGEYFNRRISDAKNRVN
ncbi:hypothetical protein [Veillonella denticariosi]|uniref:hypothetical protein n=2 Tax=Veillonella denticariosi TaxID=419208 RepID=UPI00249143F5|nr:hypothetical protein [Veillonella denticariosi]